jgi:DNA polymerase-3 subunit alpha
VSDSFVHHHVHTEYSMLDGAAKIKAALKAAAADGQPALSKTDHGNQFGDYEMWKAARDLRADGVEITAILGIEAYMAPGSRFHKKPVFWGAGNRPGKDANGESGDVSGSGKFTHMTLLATNAQGLRALYDAGAYASKEGSYGKPRMDADLLAEAIGRWPGAQIVGTTGCPGGEVQTRIRLGQLDKALEAAARYRDILGADNYFLELMDHGIPVEKLTRDALLELARTLNIPLLATNDLHYVAPSDATMHDAMLCVQTGAKLHESDRFKFAGDQYYLKTAAEMRLLFAELPAACDNTLTIAERVRPDTYDEVFLPRTDLLPKFPVPDGYTEASLLREKVTAGLQQRYPDPDGVDGIRADAHERGRVYELGVIEAANYPGYFLTVEDFVSWARAKGIRIGPGRGSAAGSIVSYALGITTVPTLEHGLLFERFLNPSRISMPDVDQDFPEAHQKEVFAYLSERWGQDFTCRIQTLGTIKAKAAIKDAARVLDVPFEVGAKMTKAFPKPISGFDAPLSVVTDKEHPRYLEAEDFRTVLASTDRAQEVYDLALQLEGLIRAAGVHACGKVVSGVNLIGLIPLTWSEKTAEWVSGFPNADALEPMGLLKVDILALKNLDIIERCVDSAVERHGVDRAELEAALVALDDPGAYEQLRSGHTVGLFQVESAGMAKLLAQMRADQFGDISAGLALYRPGPMGAEAHTAYALRKTGRQTVTPIHPELAEPLRDILGPTYAVIAYQEQVMRAVQELAGYSLGEADLLRKAMGKKKPEVLAKEQPALFAKMAENGYSQEAAQALWDVFLPFSAYAFNIAHTVSYGHITFATAWLKTHYPAEYMAAMLTQAEKPEEKALLLAECRRMGITVLVPDVNASGPSFTPVDDRTLRFGLNAVSGLGSKAIPGIISGRADGPYTSFADFLKRIPAATCDKKAVAALIRGGAFDSLGHTRRALLKCHEQGVGAHKGVKKAEGYGQFDLFSAVEEVELVTVAIPDVPEWDKPERLQLEREALGLYVSGHPLDDDAELLAGNRTMSVAELAAAIAVDDEGMVNDPSVKGAVLAGQIVSVNKWVAKSSGKPCAKIVLADLDGQIEIMAFARALGAVGHALVPDAKVRIKVSLWERDEGEPATVCVDDVAELDPALSASPSARAVGPKPLQVRTQPGVWTPDLTSRVRKIILDHPGDRPVHFFVGESEFSPAGWTVTPDVEFLTELMELFGREAIRL